MSKTGLVKVVSDLKLYVKKHQPEILTGVGIAGMIVTTITAVRATPKALELLNDVKEKHADDTDKKEYVKDVIVKVTPVYIPSFILGGLSISCLIGASSVNHRRNAALATAYSISESALREYKNKVVETIGEKKEQAVRDSIAQDKIDRTPMAQQTVFISDNGSTLCLDSITGRYFSSDRDKLEKAENEINRRMIGDMSASLNDFYVEIGLQPIAIGYDLGWNIDKKLSIDISYGGGPKGEPCLVLDYDILPFYNYEL